MYKPSKTLLAGLIAATAFLAAAAFADVPDVEMKISTTTLEVNQELTATVSSKVFCDIQMVAMGLDDPQFKEYKGNDSAVFNPPKQYKFKFQKAGKYRIAAMHGSMYCGNMGTTSMMADIVVKPFVMAPVALPSAGNLPVVAAVKPPPATTVPAPKPKAKPCKKLGKPGVGEDCDVN